VHLAIERAALPAAGLALRCGADSISRGDLLGTVRAWSAVLAGLGCGPEVPVAIALPRGSDAIAAILAVLRAGGAYVPLSGSDPDSRIAAILADCGRPMVIAAPDQTARLAALADRVITPDELRKRAAETAVPPAAVSPDNLAFIIYTSGTTGQPKGVEGTHRQLANYAQWCRLAFPHEPGECTVLHAPLAFLGSLTTIFTPLLAGWPIEIAPEGATIDDLLDLVARVRVGLLKLTPTHLRMMQARGAAGQCAARHFMIGSEPLVMTGELARWMAGHPAVASHVNHYGLTEMHGCFCHWFGADAQPGCAVPIGLPIDNVRVRIADEAGVGVPPGEPGELLVAGDSIGRGYRGRPALTAQRWIADAAGPPGARILRTGDLARVRPDKMTEIIGRADRQVKVRGHRVEPAAVEHALRALPGIAEALVLPRRDDGVTTLAAYLIPVAGVTLDTAAVRAALTERLPEPSVPGRMAVLAEFPVNANGKIDTAALPAAGPVGQTQADRTPAGHAPADRAPADRAPADRVPADRVPASRAQPRSSSCPRDGGAGTHWTRYDEVVAAAFAASLGVAGVGLHDDFFDLGGDSLAAVNVAVAIGRTLGGEVPVPAADCGTVHAYAAMVAAALGDQTETR
jgi:amino acid adenylation domain-containing protein